MHRTVLLVAILGGGCAMVEDFEQYSANYAERTDGAEPDTAEPDSDLSVPGDAAEDTARVAPADSGAPPPVDAGCPPGQRNCGSGCIDVMNDRDHCGSCSSCEEQGLLGSTTCSAGTCGCRAGATQCGSTCTYTDNDPLHCLGCNRPVADPTVVCGGACAPPLRTCKTWGYGTTCPVQCVDTASEGNHCYQYLTGETKYVRCWGVNQGACVNNKCAGSCTGVGRKVCTAGFNGTSDPDVQTCADTLHDPNHCGDCGRRCSVGQLCAEGSCKRYRPARSAADCTKSERMYTPPAWTRSVCVPL